MISQGNVPMAVACPLLQARHSVKWAYMLFLTSRTIFPPSAHAHSSAQFTLQAQPTSSSQLRYFLSSIPSYSLFSLNIGSFQVSCVTHNFVFHELDKKDNPLWWKKKLWLRIRIIQWGQGDLGCSRAPFGWLSPAQCPQYRRPHQLLLTRGDHHLLRASQTFTHSLITKHCLSNCVWHTWF